MKRLIKAGLAVMLSITLSAGGVAAADKVNLTYVEDAPSPIGNLTQADFDSMASSDFTHFVFAFINFCTAKSGGGFDCPGTDPVVVWNIKAIDDPNGTASPSSNSGSSDSRDENHNGTALVKHHNPS